MYVLHRVGSWKNVISNTCLAFKSKRSYQDWTTFWGQWQLLLLSMLFHEKNCKEAFWNFSSFMQKIIWGKLCIFFPADSLLLQQTSAMVHLQQNYANQMMLTHSYVVIHVARSCNNSSLLSSDDFPHEKWEFPRPSLKFFSWKICSTTIVLKKISLVWYYSWGVQRKQRRWLILKLMGFEEYGWRF